jgi:hypothetical protein
MSLGRGHIDPATLVLTFHYQEKQENGGIWSTVDLEQVLIEGTHFSLNARDGQFTLLPHAFWDSESAWRAGDRPNDPLLYKGQVKHPQRISAEFEYYAPEPVQVVDSLDKFGAGQKVLARRGGSAPSVIDLGAFSAAAQARLGYNVPEFIEEIETEGP